MSSSYRAASPPRDNPPSCTVNSPSPRAYLEVLGVLTEHLSKDLVDRLQHKLHKRATGLAAGGLLRELARLVVKVQVTPQPLGKIGRKPIYTVDTDI